MDLGRLGAGVPRARVNGSGTPAYLLAGCHALVTVIAIVAPGRTTVDTAEQLLALGATLTVCVATLVVPDIVLPVIPLGFLAGVLMGATLRSRAFAVGWVAGASAAYCVAMWLRPQLGLVMSDWGFIGTGFCSLGSARLVRRLHLARAEQHGRVSSFAEAARSHSAKAGSHQ